MKRSLFLSLIGSSAFAASVVRTPEEEAEDAEICKVAADVLNAYTSAKFNRIAKVMAPSTLKLFRDVVATGYEKLSERYGESEVQNVSGLGEHPTASAASDQTFFVGVLHLTEKYHPGFSKPKAEADLKIVGGVVDPQGGRTCAHVLYDYRGSIESTESKTEFRVPRLLTFVREGGKWFLISTCGLPKILNLWDADLQARQESSDPAKDGN